ncbi:MAG: hypothetical protein CSB49_07415 [Proteobacteria bacterium]|nr:MAG: hypothetical protein CSB49_07415 [Pseudomonadota bacterium]
MSSLIGRAALVPLALFAGLGSAAALASPPTQAPKGRTLTLRDVRSLVRKRAPRLLAAQAAIEVARAEVRRASRLTTRNPQLLIAAGPRIRGGEAALDVNVRLIQLVEVFGQRGARIASAEAGVRASRARAAERGRQLVARASALFLRALHTDRALTIAKDDVRLTHDLERVATQRQAAGEVGLLDVYVAQVARARATARVGGLLARRALLHGQLRGLLGENGSLALRGPLVRALRFSLSKLRARSRGRPDYQLLDAQIMRARAEARLGRAQRWPNLGVFARYGREESAHVVLGGIIFTLPIVARGQGARARGIARVAAARQERRAREVQLDAHLAGQLGAYRKLRATLARFRTQALGRLVQSLALARKSYQAGHTTLSSLIVLRREIIGAREAHLELKLRLALAGAALEAAAGGAP